MAEARSVMAAGLQARREADLRLEVLSCPVEVVPIARREARSEESGLIPARGELPQTCAGKFFHGEPTLHIGNVENRPPLGPLSRLRAMRTAMTMSLRTCRDWGVSLAWFLHQSYFVLPAMHRSNLAEEQMGEG